MTLVVDSSVVLAFLLGEPGGERLSQEAGPLLLSTVNLTEVLTKVVERGGAFDALQRERQLAAGGSVANGAALNQATLRAADYLLTAQVLYSDSNARGGGGGVGGTFGSAVGLKTKTLESQTMLTLVNVKTGVQTAVATGAARKRDVTVVGGGLLLSLGVGALGGAYTSTDIGKITSLALLDSFRKLTVDAQTRISPPVGATPPAVRPSLASGTPR